MMELPKRKQNRLSAPNYEEPGAYFITVCARERKNYFREGEAEDAPLSSLGQIVDRSIREIPNHYPTITVDHYVIMPDHIHLLLQIHASGGKRISTVIQQLKGAVYREIGVSIWQKGFYDHVIRDEADYRARWQYIDGNPARYREKKQYNRKNNNHGAV